MMGFVLGVLVGASCALGSIVWAMCRKESDVLLVDRWWMENPGRWEWLRQYELGTAGTTQRSGDDAGAQRSSADGSGNP